MIRRIYMLIIILTVSAVWLFACSATPPSDTSTGKAPDSLTTIEAQAEDIIDFTPSGNWQRINTDVTTISEAWRSYQAEAAKDGATQTMLDSFNSAFVNLQTAASAQDKTGTMQASNDISAVVVDLFELYHPAIPADVGRFDVLERQVRLDAANGNFTGVSDDLAKINKIWETLKPSILAHNGQETADQFEASLSAQAKASAAKDVKALTDEANNALELVDAMENLY
jgi:hypothetical protein